MLENVAKHLVRHGNEPGYSSINAEGVWISISIDFALAVAVLGGNDPVEFRRAGSETSALPSSKIDVLSRNIAMTSTTTPRLACASWHPRVGRARVSWCARRGADQRAGAVEYASACWPGTTPQGIAGLFRALRMPSICRSSTKWPDAATASPTRAAAAVYDIYVLSLARQRLHAAGASSCTRRSPPRRSEWAVQQGDEDWFAASCAGRFMR